MEKDDDLKKKKKGLKELIKCYKKFQAMSYIQQCSFIRELERRYKNL